MTTNSIITTSPSTLVPTVKSIEPFCHHVIACTTGCTTGSASCAGPANRPAAERAETLAVAGGALDPVDPLDGGHDRQHERRADGTDADLGAACSGIRFPKKRIRRNETAGSAGMIQAWSSTEQSALQLVDFVEIGRALVAVDQEDDGETHPDFGRCDGDDEQREHLPGDVRPLKAENATRLMLTALSISSMLMSTSTAFFRARTP